MERLIFFLADILVRTHPLPQNKDLSNFPSSYLYLPRLALSPMTILQVKFLDGSNQLC